jgi:hypothetical protein
LGKSLKFGRNRVDDKAEIGWNGEDAGLADRWNGVDVNGLDTS